MIYKIEMNAAHNKTYNDDDDDVELVTPIKATSYRIKNVTYKETVGITQTLILKKETLGIELIIESNYVNSKSESKKNWGIWLKPREKIKF